MTDFIGAEWIGKVETIPPQDGWKPSKHFFEKEMIHAVNAAIATGRPLLLRGDPGVGKSQIARAAALATGRAFASIAIDARSEASDLLWHYDVVARLAEAQVWGALKPDNISVVRDAIAVSRYIEPRPLWWGLAWKSAQAQFDRCAKRCAASAECDEDSTHAGMEPPQPPPSQPPAPQSQPLKSPTHLPPTPEGWSADDGWVILVDEMDKADSAVPNGLLDLLGHGRFRTPAGDVVEAEDPCPLIVVTTNEDRALPDAFVRRCWVMHLELPEADELIDWLVERGRVHFGLDEISDDALDEAAKLLRDWRTTLSGHVPCLPGQAEYIDLLRALKELRVPLAQQADELSQYEAYAFDKHPRRRLGRKP